LRWAGSIPIAASRPRHAQLLKALADGLAALKGALVELGRWDSTLIMTYSEFGRRPRENLSNGAPAPISCWAGG
jgi:uncharacterized protein (DUF1501 family)